MPYLTTLLASQHLVRHVFIASLSGSVFFRVQSVLFFSTFCTFVTSSQPDKQRYTLSRLWYGCGCVRSREFLYLQGTRNTWTFGYAFRMASTELNNQQAHSITIFISNLQVISINFFYSIASHLVTVSHNGKIISKMIGMNFVRSSVNLARRCVLLSKILHSRTLLLQLQSVLYTFLKPSIFIKLSMTKVIQSRISLNILCR